MGFILLRLQVTKVFFLREMTKEHGYFRNTTFTKQLDLPLF
jgi:hypothetical protein